jgi:hypothetical protein
MIKKFGHFISESRESDYLLYYAFDWDDNILNMPTKIHMDHLVNGEWVPTEVSTAEFAEVRNDKDNWRIDYNVAFIEFRDQGERGDNAFLEDTKTAISQGKLGPAWDDFIECLSNGSIFAIITARGHESGPMRKGIEWIIDNVLTEDQIYQMYNQLVKYSYIFGETNVEYERILRGQPSQNKLVKLYLDSCEYVGVSSPSRGGSPDNPEKAKEDALLDFKAKVNDYAKNVGISAKIGFSDDDLKNVKHIEDLIDSLRNEQFPNIVEFVVKGTKDPKNITKKVLSREEPVTETSQQNTGMEGSVLKFTQFGNMAGQLNPIGQDQRQDDFANQFKRQTKYLTKTSKDILGEGKRKKKVKKSSK